MLRYPYGPRSDPIARFAFEEFKQREGLRALLWGHPAWLLASLLAGPDTSSGDSGGDGVVDDLPFHYAVDRHGDQIALPCTDAWVGTDAATHLAAYGLVALVGHRGLPQVQLAPLQTLGGQPLSTRPATARSSRGQVFHASANPRGALSAILETELNGLLAAKTSEPGAPPSGAPGLDALIAGPGA